MSVAGGRIAAGVGANLIGQHAQDRNQDATVYVGNLDPQVRGVNAFLYRELVFRTLGAWPPCLSSLAVTWASLKQCFKLAAAAGVLCADTCAAL